jgi:hypothetical protein
VALAVEGDGVGFATESYAVSALYTTLASLSGALWRIRRARGLSVAGEAKRKQQTLTALLANAKGCIYCAGANAATTIEHMPPRSIFEGKHRPKGLEFPACEECNNSTSHSDLVAAMLARLWPNADTATGRKDITKILRAVANNVPAILPEMYVGQAGEKLARKRHNIPDDGHPLRADGPLLTKHIETFAAKLGFALHYEVTGSWVPAGGGVQVMWFSNVQALNGQIPDSLFTMLRAQLTLRQGEKSVEDQFQYSYALPNKGTCFTSRRSACPLPWPASPHKIARYGLTPARLISPCSRRAISSARLPDDELACRCPACSCPGDS